MKYVVCVLIFAIAAVQYWALCRISGISDVKYEEAVRKKFSGEDGGDG